MHTHTHALPLPAEPSGSARYHPWGIYRPGMEPEPNNKFQPENCVAANWSQTVGGVWGWSDTNCIDSYPFLCKIPRGWRADVMTC